jgi:hypothetical protein
MEGSGFQVPGSRFFKNQLETWNLKLGRYDERGVETFRRMEAKIGCTVV